MVLFPTGTFKQRHLCWLYIPVLLLAVWVLLTCLSRRQSITLVHPDTIPRVVPSQGKIVGTKNGTSKKTNMMKMIQTVCKRISDGGYVIPPAEDAVTSTLRGVVDHYHRVEFCDIPKSGTTSWLVMFYKLTEKERAQRTKWFSRHPYSWLGQAPSDGYRDFAGLGINRLSIGSEAHREKTKDGLPDPREEYYKFVVVRHPLERLASAYLDKVNGKKERLSVVKDIKRNVGRENETGIVKASFEEFLKYVAKPDTEITNIHFRTYQTTCEPCTMNYNYIAHLETIWMDLEEILPHLDASKYTDKFPTVKLRETGDNRYVDMYKSLPMSVLQPVFHKYKADADMFGYTFDKYIPEKSPIIGPQ